ncbi:hypothetical protein ACQKGC_17390 [Allorhizobium pseudoryzae]|uniref:hypothetical protein n=1 Tax=Allorhizobium pseudoryzae TaxID=379684 RepID=UPI003D06C43D
MRLAADRIPLANLIRILRVEVVMDSKQPFDETMRHEILNVTEKPDVRSNGMPIQYLKALSHRKRLAEHV